MTISMTTRPTRTRRRLASAGLAAVLLLGAAACGDDDDDGDEGSKGSEDAAFDLAAYCQTEIDLDAAFDDVDWEDVESIKAAAEDASALVSDLEDNHPEQFAADVATLREAVDDLAATGDTGVFEDGTIDEIDARVHAYDLEECDWTTVDVTATESDGEYHFELTPPTKAGAISFELQNDGAEPHVLILGKKRAGVAGSALEAFREVGEADDPESAFGESFDEVGSAFAPPSGSGYFVRDVEAGDYVLFCPIPTGTTGDTEGTGPPHFVHGMVEGFTID